MVWFVENKEYIPERELAFLLKFAFVDYNFGIKEKLYRDWREFGLLLKICDIYGISIKKAIFKGDNTYNDEIEVQPESKDFYKGLKNLTEKSASLNDLQNLYYTKDKNELKYIKEKFKLIGFDLSLKYDFKKVNNKIKKDLIDYIELYINNELNSGGKNIEKYSYKQTKLYDLLYDLVGRYNNPIELKSNELLKQASENDFQLLFVHDVFALYQEGMIEDILSVSYNFNHETGIIKGLLDEERLKENSNRQKTDNQELKVVVVDKIMGIYLKNDKEHYYPISQQRYELLKILKNGSVSGPKLLEEKIYKNYQSLNQAKRDINKKSKDIGLIDPVIKSEKNKGYYLNKDRYLFEF